MPPTKKITSAIGRPVWADVSFSALIHNLNAIRDFVNPKWEERATPGKILSVVKGNGYGHGGPQVAKALEKAGSDWFGVTGAGEGEQVRKAGVRKPILALTSFWPGEEAQLLANKISPAIIRCEQLAALDSAASSIWPTARPSLRGRIPGRIWCAQARFFMATIPATTLRNAGCKPKKSCRCVQ